MEDFGPILLPIVEQAKLRIEDLRIKGAFSNLGKPQEDLIEISQKLDDGGYYSGKLKILPGTYQPKTAASSPADASTVGDISDNKSVTTSTSASTKGKAEIELDPELLKASTKFKQA